MKTSLWILATLLALASTSAQAEESLHYNLVNFNESASVRVPNDTMNVVLEIRESGKSRQDVSNTVTRRVNAVLNRAKLGGKVFDVESGNRSTYPEYGERNIIRGWTDVAQIRISSQDFDALSKLVADSQNEAALDGLSFSVSPDKRTAAVNQASDQALKTFQQRALHMSKTLGFSGYKIVRIEFNQSFSSEQGDFAAPQMMMATSARSASFKSAEVAQTSPGAQEIRQNIHVSVQLY